jgi:hypothetical protein
MRIIDDPQTYFRAHSGSRNTPVALTKFGQGINGHDWMAGPYRDEGGRLFAFLRIPGLIRDGGGEVYYPVDSLARHGWFAEANIPAPGFYQFHSFDCYQDARQGGRLVIKFELDAGNHVRRHTASFTTDYAP